MDVDSKLLSFRISIKSIMNLMYVGLIVTIIIIIIIIITVGFVNILRVCLFVCLSRTEQSKPVPTFLRVFNPPRGKVVSNI